MKQTKYIVTFANNSELTIYALNPFEAMIKAIARKIDNGEYCQCDSVTDTESKEFYKVSFGNILNSITKR